MKQSSHITSFLPTTEEEIRLLGWECLDIILVTGDTYIDSPHIGAAVIGRVLLKAGFRVGIIAQPGLDQGGDISRLGEPELFWGVTAGSVDSLIANHTPSGKPRRKDDLTPGGRNNRRPDRATIAYTNLIRRHCKHPVPIVLGGIEASLRRISHYDAWTDSVRRSILFDAKADYIVYGMGERSIVALAQALRDNQDPKAIRGLCYVASRPPENDCLFQGQAIELPAHTAVAADKVQFTRMFSLFYANADPHTAKRLFQQQDTRYLVHNPPQWPLSPAELDAVHELPYAHEVHPFYARMGSVTALDTIRFAITTHRGCFGECRFCAIAVHQGRQVVSRSQFSVIREAKAITAHPRFKGIVSNVGGPTANMYAMTCARMTAKGGCARKGCLFPKPCRSLQIDHGPQIELLQALRQVPGLRKAFVGSGLRYDLIVADQANGQNYLEEILRYHASGQLKIAPEHISNHVLSFMGKPGQDVLDLFLNMFQRARKKTRSKIYLTYYLMAAHPACTLADMQALRSFALKRLKIMPEQVQIFTPTPSTYATVMYHTTCDPFSGQPIFVEKKLGEKIRQKTVLAKKIHHKGSGSHAS